MWNALLKHSNLLDTEAFDDDDVVVVAGKVGKIDVDEKETFFSTGFEF